MARIPQLDGIRGIAISLVLIWHYVFGFWWNFQVKTDLGGPAARALKLLSFSWSGVDLFFVLSGFLIGGILIDARASPNYFRTFFARRIVRIVPLYGLVLIVGFAFYPQVPAVTDGILLAWPWYATFTQNIWMALNNSWSLWLAPSWSLAVEEQFYLLLPPLILLVPPRKLLPVLAGLIVAAFALRCGMYVADAPRTAFHVLLATRMDTLLIGVVCAVAVRDPKAAAWLAGNPLALYSALTVLGLGVAVFTFMDWSMGSAALSVFGFSLLGAFYGCVLLLAINPHGGPVRWICGLAPLRRMGVLAYFIYLAHTLIPQFVFRALGLEFSQGSMLSWALLAASGLLTISLAELSWRYFEGPLLRAGHRITRYAAA